jgi:hypothetical protein
MITIDDRDKKRTTEIGRVKCINGGWPWVVSNRQDGHLFLDDSVTLLKGIAKPTADKLEPHGLKTIRDLRNASDDRLKQIGKQKLGRGTSFNCLKLSD